MTSRSWPCRPWAASASSLNWSPIVCRRTVLWERARVLCIVFVHRVWISTRQTGNECVWSLFQFGCIGALLLRWDHLRQIVLHLQYVVKKSLHWSQRQVECCPSMQCTIGVIAILLHIWNTLALLELVCTVIFSTKASRSTSGQFRVWRICKNYVYQKDAYLRFRALNSIDITNTRALGTYDFKNIGLVQLRDKLMALFRK